MATLGELKTIVQDIVTDSSYDSTITGFLNRAVRICAAGVNVPGINALTLPLPDLFSIGTVTTGDTYRVALPDDYGRDVQFVANSDGAEIDVYDIFGDLARAYPSMDKSGKIAAVAVKGSYLYYQPIPPGAETLTVHYYRQPVDMSADNDEPDGIPAHLQESLLCNYAAKEIFKRIEDGIEGNPFNTKLYEALWQQAILDLDRWLPMDGGSLFLD